APNDAEVLARLAGLALYTADFPLAESLTGRARIVDPADYEIFESSLWPACGRDSLAPRVEKQLADYPTTPVNTLRMRQWAAACDGEYADWAQLAIEQARIDRDPGSALRALLVLASMDFPEALNRVGAAQRILAGQFSTDPVVPPAYFTSILPERLETWRRYLGAGFEGGDGYGVALLLAGEYGQVEKLVDDGIRLWERWYQGIDWIWHTETLETFAWKAWLLTERGERDQAAELAGEMMQALRDKELTEWSGSHKLLYDLPLMILLLNGEERQALDWLADAEQARWLHFQPLLTSPVYAEFRELPEAAATLERMTAWRARVLDEVLAMGLPEVENPDLLLDYMAALARPSHHERARIALHFDDDPAGALGHYANALREDPDNARIIQQAADLALEFGLVDEAVRLLEHAAAVAPDDADTHSSLSLAYGHAKRWPEAVASARRAVELQPDAGFFQRWLGQMLLMNGEAHEAKDVFSQIRNEGQRNMGLIMAYHALGRIDESDALLSEWLESAWGPSFFVAYVLAFRGDKDPAFEWLEKAAATERIVNTAATFPMLLNLHDDLRWLPFLERIGKSPEQLAGIELKLSLPPPATSQRVSQAGE
ncbi:MAG: tetratricopeptide repeat protein, partial [Gammaproteobacteria bacterium]|nr:tetratricopeptide repeat protein [Gammaproteobacteria bacterium]